MRVLKAAIINSFIFWLLNLTTLICSAQSWSNIGNSGTSTTNLAGIKEPKALVFKTNKVEGIRITKTRKIYPLNVENSNAKIEMNVPENANNGFIKFTDTIGRIKKASVIRSRGKRKISAPKVQLTEMTYRYFLAGWEIN